MLGLGALPLKHGFRLMRPSEGDFIDDYGHHSMVEKITAELETRGQWLIRDVKGRDLIVVATNERSMSCRPIWTVVGKPHP